MMSTTDPAIDPMMESVVEADEWAELASEVTPPGDADQVALAAWASDLLRQMGEADRDVAHLTAIRGAEVARITARHAPELERLAKRRAVLETAVAGIVERYQFTGKMRSVTVGYGVIGKKQVPERLKIVNGAAVVAWAYTNAPDLVEVKVVETETVPHAKLVEWFKEKAAGEVPDGCEHTAAHDVPVIKPELGAAA